MSLSNYKIHVLQSPESKKWWGELWIDNKLYEKTLPMMSKAVAINRLNKIIECWNTMNNGKVPLYKDKPAVTVPVVEPENIPKAKLEKKEQPKMQTQEKAVKDKRKPFTPYGLKGYLVDKKGNVRLILDRRANACTIVLEPEMFNALADMVRKTQGQKNELV